MFIEELKNEEARLSNAIACVEKHFETKSKGRLHAFTNHGTFQYTVRFAGKKDKYIPKANVQLAAKLAQQEYEEKLLERMKKELASVKNALKCYAKNSEGELYLGLHNARKALVHPIRLPDSEYVVKWQSTHYEGKPFSLDAPELYTERGERVRSKSEKIIADKLYNMGVPYRYECPLMISGFGVVYPDFTILNVAERKEYYWEHFGMMDNSEYCLKVIKKWNSYINAGDISVSQFIITFESLKAPLDTRTIASIIKQYAL